jgi:hypothetical protein
VSGTCGMNSGAKNLTRSFYLIILFFMKKAGQQKTCGIYPVHSKDLFSAPGPLGPEWHLERARHAHPWSEKTGPTQTASRKLSYLSYLRQCCASQTTVKEVNDGQVSINDGQILTMTLSVLPYKARPYISWLVGLPKSCQ